MSQEDVRDLSRRQSDTETKITRVEAQLANLSAIHRKLEIVAKLTTNFALLAQKQKMNTTEINKLSKELSELHRLIEENKDLCFARIQGEHDRFDTVNVDIQALVNKVKGAWVVTSILLGTVFTAVVGFLLWVLNELVVIRTLLAPLVSAAGG